MYIGSVNQIQSKMEIKLNHSSIYKILQTGVFDPSIDSIEDFVKTVDQVARNLYPNDREKQDQFKGDCLEILSEYLLRTKGNDKRLAIKNYQPTKKADDYGVDGWGIGFDLTDYSVQIKYRKNPTEVLTYRDLSTYIADSRKFGSPSVSNPHNMAILTTGKDISHLVKERIPGIKMIGIDQWKSLVNNDPFFWNGFYESLDESIKGMSPRNRHIPDKEQYDIIGATKDFFDSDQERGQILAGTGFGKTLIQKYISEYVIEKTKKIAINEMLSEILNSIENNPNGFVLVNINEPRLALLQQTISYFHDQKNIPWDFMKVGSGGIEELKDYPEDVELMDLAASTSKESIIKKIKSCQTSGTPLILFSTYHSSFRIGEALKELNIKADLQINDEAHNTVSNGKATKFRKVLFDNEIPAKKRLFFTATQRISTSSSGVGMNNESLYGPIIAEISAAELSRAGKICFPRLVFTELDDKIPVNPIGYNRSTRQLTDFARIIIAAFKHDQKNMADGVRMIVACNSTEQAHDLEGLKDMTRNLPGVNIEALTTHERMNKTKKRSEIFSRFQNSKNSILLQYDIVSEGIDLEKANSGIPLRGMGEIKTVQFTGRMLRLDQDDRTKLRTGELPLPFSEKDWYKKWKKPFGYIHIPIIRGSDSLDWAMNFYYTILTLRSHGYTLSELIGSPGSMGGEEDEPNFETEDLGILEDFIKDLKISKKEIAKIKNILEDVEDILSGKTEILEIKEAMALVHLNKIRSLAEYQIFRWDNKLSKKLPLDPKEYYKTDFPGDSSFYWDYNEWSEEEIANFIQNEKLLDIEVMALLDRSKLPSNFPKNVKRFMQNYKTK